MFIFKNKKDIELSNNKNIFRDSFKYDRDCYFVNLQCNQDCYCDKDTNNNIRRIFFDTQIFKYEVYIYLSLLKNNINITPLISNQNNDIIYITKDLVSLRTFLIKNPKHVTLIINEVFAFVNTFSKYNFIHGNLHIDNIYIDTKNKYKFYVIDLCNSYYNTNSNNIDSYKYSSNNGDFNFKRKSYIDLNNNTKEHEKFKLEYLNYWDFLCLFFSLNLYFEKSKDHLNYIKLAIQNYMNKEKVDEILYYCTIHLNNDDYRRIRHKYHSI